MRVAVVGGGVFGAAAAGELAARGHAVDWYDRASVPAPDAASTDLNKLVRADYGADPFYRDLGLRAIAGWEAWNAEAGRRLYHPDGLLVLAGLAGSGFEHDSAAALAAAGVDVARFAGSPPVAGWSWTTGGYVNPRAGWAAASEVVSWLASRAGARRIDGPVTDLADVPGDRVVVAAGVWSAALVPALAPLVRAVAQPIWYLRPADPVPWSSPDFLPWCADIARTGWYGFPAVDGVVKVANHGPGREVDPDAPRARGDDEDAALYRFLAAHLPDLARAPIVARRACLYTDTFDGDFVIDAVPGDPRVVVATGGSGHAFKFAPLLGGLAADAVEGRPIARFAWRAPGARRAEAARKT